MNVDLVRGVITALSLACFVGILIWAYSPRNRARFEQDARLPFEE